LSWNDRYLVALVVVLLIPATVADQEKSLVILYTPDMTDFAGGIADLLSEDFGDSCNFMVTDDPSVVSFMLSLPNIGCVILPVLRGKQVETLIDPLCAYFEAGGAAIGFQGCCGQSQAEDLARDVFPAFGNSTGSPTMKSGVPVNEYVRDEEIPTFADLPAEFDLLGQFFTYSATLSRELLEPDVPGDRIVLYRDRGSGAPLVIAYENEAGSRSISFTGCFVRTREDAANYYGNLLDDENFGTMISDSLEWTLSGKTRFSEYGNIYPEMIEGQVEADDSLRQRAEERMEQRERNRLLALAAAWIVGILFSFALIYRAFLGRAEGPGEVDSHSA